MQMRKKKIDAQYDHALEAEVRAWITSLTGEPVNDFIGDLKSGVTLCKLINVIKPGSVKTINQQKFPFKQMENLSFFLDAVRAYGLPEYTLFRTPDVYEAGYPTPLLTTLSSLKRETEKSGGGGTRSKSPAAPSQWASSAPKPVALPASNAAGSGSVGTVDPTGVANFGVDVEVRKAIDSKTNQEDVAKVQSWIEKVTGISAGGNTFGQYLHDGTVLCELVNKIKPGSVTKINKSKINAFQMENISKYCEAARALGLQDYNNFRTDDLYEEKNLGQVILNLLSLGRIAKQIPSFAGPQLD